MNELKVLTTKKCEDYELLDSGDGEKLERYGNVIFRRPDPQALWKKNLSNKDWDDSDAQFIRSGRGADWKFKPGTSEKWTIKFGGLQFYIRPTAFKHTGLVPEQLENWNWLRNLCNSQEIRVLNLFGYTGGATLACAQAGASVCHVDGSKVAIGWAKDNAQISGMADKPIRWILDDAITFVSREIKRGKKYEGIIMDPPAFGHGPNNEMWKIEKDFLNFVDLCFKILSDSPLFFLINGYASGYSPIAYENNLLPLIKKYGGQIEKGELAIQETKTERLLPCGIFARWSK
jgi:23S rRNA (cytosine1962-C5)-methyltransferase